MHGTVRERVKDAPVHGRRILAVVADKLGKIVEHGSSRAFPAVSPLHVDGTPGQQQLLRPPVLALEGDAVFVDPVGVFGLPFPKNVSNSAVVRVALAIETPHKR